MRNETMWAIRDARGLTTSEKAFLFVVESRGTAKTYRKTLMNDTGASDGQITNLVRSLTTKGCLHAGRDGSRTTYRVSHDGVSRFIPTRSRTHSASDSAQSVSPMAHSVSVEGSLSEDNKKNRKKNIKDNMKKNETAPVVADAPTVTAPAQGEVGEGASETSMGNTGVSERGDVLFEAKPGSGTYLLSKSGVSALSLPETGTPAMPDQFEKRAVSDWREIRATRPLTREEKMFLDARSCAFQDKKRARRQAANPIDGW